MNEKMEGNRRKLLIWHSKRKKKKKMQQTRMAYSKKMCISLTNDDALLLRYFLSLSHFIFSRLFSFGSLFSDWIRILRSSEWYHLGRRETDTRDNFVRDITCENCLLVIQVILASVRPRRASKRGIHGNRWRFALFFTGSEWNKKKAKIRDA